MQRSGTLLHFLLTCSLALVTLFNSHELVARPAADRRSLLPEHATEHASHDALRQELDALRTEINELQDDRLAADALMQELDAFRAEISELQDHMQASDATEHRRTQRTGGAGCASN